MNNPGYQQYLGKPGVSVGQAKFFGMIENIDSNFGALIKRLDSWDIAENTLIIYLGSDNGGTTGVKIFNAGMRGNKGTPYQGGTPACCRDVWKACHETALSPGPGLLSAFLPSQVDTDGSWLTVY